MEACFSAALIREYVARVIEDDVKDYKEALGMSLIYQLPQFVVGVIGIIREAWLGAESRGSHTRDRCSDQTVDF